MIRIPLVAALLCTGPVADPIPTADRVTLESGQVLSGRVAYEDDQRVVLVPERGRGEQELPRAEVAEVVSLERSLRKAFVQLDELEAGPADGLLDVADFCEARGLSGEARLLRYKALLREPHSSRAFEALGGRQRARGWQLQVERRWLTFEELSKRSGKWREALEFPTTHFVLRTDLPLEPAILLALDLERLYLEFYDLMHEGVPLRVFDEVPEVRVYLESGSYPRPPYTSDSWFDWDDNVVHVRAARPDASSREPMLFETTRAILRNGFYATRGKGGQIAPWATLGLCEVFAAAIEGPPGSTSFALGKPSPALYVQHARGEKDVNLSRVLVASWSELYEGTIGPRIRSRSYTLADYLLFAEEGEHRPAFLRYLESSFAGQGSRTHLAQILEADLDELERAWERHVEEVAAGL